MLDIRRWCKSPMLKLFHTEEDNPMLSNSWLLLPGTVTLAILTLISCSSEPVPVPISLPGPSPTSRTPTEVAVLPTPTLISGPTPTEATLLATPSPATPTSSLALPVLPGTPAPMPQEPITPDNVDQIRELAIWGKGRIEQLAYSPDGKTLAVGTTAGVWLYDAETLAELRFINTGNFVGSLAFTSDSLKLVTDIGASTLATWDVSTGELLNRIQVREGFQSSGAGSQAQSVLSAGAMLLAATMDDWTVGLWEVTGGKPLQTVKSDKGNEPIETLAISPDQTLMAIGSYTTIKVWDLRTGNLLHTLPGFDRTTYSLAFAPGNDETMLLAASGNEGKIWLWDARSGTLIRTLEASSSSLAGGLAFSVDGDLLAVEVSEPSSTSDTPYIATLQIWRVADGILLHTLELDVEVIGTLIFSPDNRLLTLEIPNGMVQRWDTQTGVLIDDLMGFNANFGQIGQAPPLPAFLPNSNMFISNPFNYQIELWSLKIGQVVKTLIGHKSTVTNLVLSADGSKLVSAELWDDTIRIWDPATGQNLDIHKFYTYSGEDKALAISPNSQLIASGESVRGRNPGAVYNITQLNEWVYFLPGNGSLNPAFSPDGQKIASVSGVISVTLSKAETGESLHTLETEPVGGGLVFSPDSQVLAVGSRDGRIQLWDSATGALMTTLSSDTSYSVTSLAYSPDGQMLAAGLKDAEMPVGALNPTIWLWNVKTGMLLKTIEGYQANVIYLAFSPDGALLATVSLDGTMRLWGVPPE